MPDPAQAVADAVGVDLVPHEATLVDLDREVRIAEVTSWSADVPAHASDLAEDPVDVEVRADGREVVGPRVVEEV